MVAFEMSKTTVELSKGNNGVKIKTIILFQHKNDKLSRRNNQIFNAAYIKFFYSLCIYDYFVM